MELNLIDPTIQSDAIRGHPNLRILNIADNGLGNVILGQLLDALVSCTSLADINLTKNMLSGLHISDLLLRNQSIAIIS